VEEPYYFIDSGRAAFATLKLRVTRPTDGSEKPARKLEVHLGEKLSGSHTVDRRPASPNILYKQLTLSLSP